jgi:cysteine desulfurase
VSYFDYNATAPVRPDVVSAVAAAMEQGGNASSVHHSGRAARQAIEGARERLARAIGTPAQSVIFTSGGTEANNLALLGARAERILVSAIEHDSVLRTAQHSGRRVGLIPVTSAGVIDLVAMDALLGESDAPALISVMLANNETGIIQPVREVAERAHAAGALVHCDAVQGLGRIAIDTNDLNADLVTLSGHKVGGPPGIGALVARDIDVIDPILHGGGQEARKRAGTENMPAIVGFGIAAEMAQAELPHMAALAEVRDGIERRLLEAVPDAWVVGTDRARLPNTICIVLPFASSETLVMALDLEGVEVSAGSACSSGKVASSHVLTAMDVPDADRAIRISFGLATSPDEIEHLVEAVHALYIRIQGGDTRSVA